MYNLSAKSIDTYEKKISVEQAYRWYKSGSILFPKSPLVIKRRKVEKTADTLESVFMGILFPYVYVSELQDGRLLVLDASDRLRHLFGFLDGNYPAGYMEFYPELEGYYIHELEESDPRLTSVLYDYAVPLQLIEYKTPKYLHIQVGKHVEKWNYSREQGVRNVLYGGKAVRLLEKIASEKCMSAGFFSRSSLNRQYVILRILMYRLIFTDRMEERECRDMGLQQLLDRTMSLLENCGHEILGEMMNDVPELTEEISQWEKKSDYDLSENRGKEPQIRILSYLYAAAWECSESGYSIKKNLEKIVWDEPIMTMIEKDEVNYGNIRKQCHEIEGRLR